MTRALRYLAPNLITSLGILCGLLSVAASVDGRYYDAGWFIIYASLTDRLDGLVARTLRGTSELGVQLDSLADLITFGIAPATLLYASLGGAPELPFHDGAGRLYLMVAAAAWVLSACFRLARYNISMEVDDRKPVIFFGVPTTLAAGTLAVWFLTFMKYSPEGAFLSAHSQVTEQNLYGALTTPEAVWRWFPAAVLVGAFMMASNLRMPKLGLARSKVATVFVMSNVAAGSVCGLLNIYPEYLVWPPTLWLVLFLVWGQVSPTARRMRPPPILPSQDPPPGEEPVRPEDDLVDDHEVPNEQFQL